MTLARLREILRRQKSPWVRLWRMVDEAPWRVLADSLCSSIPDKCAQPLNVKAVDETSVLNRLRVCNDFSRVDATEFTSEEIDLLLGRVVEEHAWMMDKLAAAGNAPVLVDSERPGRACRRDPVRSRAHAAVGDRAGHCGLPMGQVRAVSGLAPRLNRP